MPPLKLTQPNCCHFCVTSFGHVITKLWSSLDSGPFYIVRILKCESSNRLSRSTNYYN